MHKPYFMGIDIGTYESKGVLTDSDANIISLAACPHGMETPYPGWAEHDAEGVWWHDLCQISRTLIAKSAVSTYDIDAVGVSGIGPCCLPVDGNLNPLRKAILYGIDVRAASEIEQLKAAIGEEKILRDCGTPVTSQSAGAKVLWIQHNEPDVFARTYKFVTSGTYLVAKLTGEFSIDRYTAAAWAPLYSLDKQDWADDLYGICRRGQLAQCHWTNEVVGTVREQAARETGLAMGTKVTASTADAGAEALSVGVTRPGDMMIMYGSSIFIIHVVDRPMRDSRLWAGPYLFEGTYAITAGMSCAGTLTRWFRDNLACDIARRAESEGKNPYAEMMEMAKGIPAGSAGLIVLPYFSGERTPINDPNASGVIFGLNLLHTRAHIYKAILEGLGYGIQQHFAIFEELGIQTNKVMAVGGGVKNHIWLQAVSDICAREQRYAVIDIGATYGDAMLAALSTGRYKSPLELEKLVQIRGTMIPDATNHMSYKPLLCKYEELYKSTKHIMHG